MDRDILRGLAALLREIAELEVQKDKQRLFRALNGLRPIRPVVLLDELPWNQLAGGGELKLECEDPYLRAVENGMRMTLYKWRHCAGDMFLRPYYRLSRAVHIGDMGITVQEDTLASDAGNNIVSHRYKDQLADMASVEKLHDPEITVDDAATQRRFELLSDIFGDVLPVRLVGCSMNHYSPVDSLSLWRGVGPLYMDLAEDPDKMHAIMRRYLDISLRTLQRVEDMGLMETDMDYIHCTPALCDDLPTDQPLGHATRRNIWGRGAAQAFSSVSPAMHDEFDIEYEKRYFEGFGLVYYGCCEALDKKIDIVKKLPNLRKISVTPWADVRACAQQMGRDYVLARKPNPASVAVPRLDEQALRKDILETLDACRENGTPCEFVLKDISSVCYHPDNLTRWERVVMETVENY